MNQYQFFKEEEMFFLLVFMDLYFGRFTQKKWNWLLMSGTTLYNLLCNAHIM